MKLKFKLEKFERALVFQILEQSPKFMAGFGIYPSFSHNGIDVSSSSSPQILTNSAGKVVCIYLRGSQKSQDLMPQSTLFSSNELRDIAFSDIIDTLKCWSEKWVDFKDNKETKPDDKNTFTF